MCIKNLSLLRIYNLTTDKRRLNTSMVLYVRHKSQ